MAGCQATDAVPLLRDLLIERRRVLGPDHPHTLDTGFALAVALYASRLDAAGQLADVISEHVRVLGADRPLTESARRLLATVQASSTSSSMSSEK
jgi:hypothetical protein